MGIVIGGVFGKVKNAVGNVVFSSWKGRNTVRSKALSVANPRTTPQINQRTKFRGASKFFSSILGVWVKPLWDRFSGDVTGYNAIMSANTEIFDDGGTPVWGNLKMSKGKMVSPTVNTCVADESIGSIAGSVQFPVDASYGLNGESCFIVAFNESDGAFIGSDEVTGNPNSAVNYSIVSDEVIAGEIYAVFFALKRPDGTAVSDATYHQVTAIA